VGFSVHQLRADRGPHSIEYAQRLLRRAQLTLLMSAMGGKLPLGDILCRRRAAGNGLIRNQLERCSLGSTFRRRTVAIVLVESDFVAVVAFEDRQAMYPIEAGEIGQDRGRDHIRRMKDGLW